MIPALRPRSEFTRNVLTMMTGATVAQAIPIAISPILTRLYTPEDFGVFALYVSISTMFAVIATGRYELAIMLPKKDEDAVSLVQLSLMITFLIATITLIVVALFNTEITQLLGNPSISNWLYFIPLTVCLTGLYQSLYYWNNRKKKYNNIVISRIAKSGTSSSIQLGGGMEGVSHCGLIIGEITAQGISSSILVKKAWNNDKVDFIKIRYIKIIALMKKHKKILYYALPMGLINSASNQIKPLVFSAIFSATIVGWVYMAERIIKAPLSIVSASYSSVFFQQFTNTKKKVQLYTQSYLLLLSFSLISLFPIYSHGEPIFEFIFGPDWRKAGEVASALYLMICFSFASSAISTVFTTVNRNEVSLAWQIGYFIGLVFFISYFAEGDYLVLIRYLSYWGASMYFVLFILGLYCILDTEKRNKNCRAKSL